MSEENFEYLSALTAYESDERAVLLTCGVPRVQLSLLAPDLVRVRLSKDGQFGPDHSWAAVKTDWPKVEYTLRDEDSCLELQTSELTIRVAKSPCRLSFFNRSGELISEDYKPYGMGWLGERVRCWKSMPYDEHYYGFGEKTGPLDKRRRRMVMWNTDAYGYSPDTDPLYKSVPFFIGVKDGRAYGIFFDNTYRTEFDMGFTSEEHYSFEAAGGELNYYFFFGPEIKKILERFTELTGRMPLPPKWALGNQQCRYSYYPASRVMEVADRFRQRDIPADVLYLDIHYMDGYKVFTWNKERFPDPKKLVSELHARGFKVISIIDPGVKADTSYKVYREGIAKDFFCKYGTGEVYFGRVWPGICAFPDFTKDEARSWWGDLHAELVQVGIDGIWNDMNEPAVFPQETPEARRLLDQLLRLLVAAGDAAWDVYQKTMDAKVVHYDNGLMTPHAKNHNVYGLSMCRATYEGLLRISPNKRPFVLTRAAYAGIQRYAAVWTGDNVANWDHLALQIPMFLNLGLSGVPFVGADIGGLAGSPSPELLVRWYQIGAFVPLCRNHTQLGTYDKEPWMFGDYHEGIIRRHLKLRYRLMPYLYTAFYEAWKRGYPLLRPLLFEFQGDRNTYNVQDEFLVGDELLIAPVIKDATNHRLVYLPEGTWIDYWTRSEHKAPCHVEIEAPLDRVPIFVKAGSIIPMQPDMDYVDQRPVDPLTLDVYPSKEESSYTLYEDDGSTLNYRDGQYSLTTYRCVKKGENILFTIETRQGNYSPPQRSYWILFNSIQSEPKKILLNSRELRKLSSKGELEKAVNAWFYEAPPKTVHVKIPDRGVEERIQLSLS